MSLRGRLENVSDIAKNQHCHVGSVGNVGSQKPFVGELMDCFRADSWSGGAAHDTGGSVCSSGSQRSSMIAFAFSTATIALGSQRSKSTVDRPIDWAA